MSDLSSMNRRSWMKQAAGVAALGVAGSAAGADDTVAVKKRIQQSLVQWCYQKYWNVDEMCQVAKKLGCVSVELVAPKDWPTLKKHGLVCAIAGSHMFVQGMNNPKYQEMCIDK